LDAAHKAFLESLQSWSATEWLWQNNPKEMPYWDTIELSKRIDDIKNSKQFGLFTSDHPQCDDALFSRYFLDTNITTQNHEGVYVAGIGLGVNLSGEPYEMAEIDMQPGEEVRVFTRYNH
jgi:hypothetical protein